MTQLVGILNITPDSFSDGGQFLGPSAAIERARKLFADGASLVDVGAESTRPGATPLTHQQEWERLAAVLPVLIKMYPGKISLDTYHPETADKALSMGDVIINDVTGMNNPAMRAVIAKYKARCIISHLPGVNTQAAHDQKPVESMQDIANDLLTKVAELGDKGIPANNIILDPGIGFGKTMALNRELLTFPLFLPQFSTMIGYSRKRFLGEDRMLLAPNLEAGKVAIASGAAYLRVHDVAGHKQLLKR